MNRNRKLLFLLLGCCVFTAYACILPPKGGKVDLTPNDPRPVFGITVQDAAEVALLEQQLKLEPLYLRESTLFFHEAPGLIERLQAMGYTLTKADPYQVYHRVVRVSKKGDEQELLKTGVRLINRERNYWVVQGSLTQLITIKRIGYQLTTITPYEPRPREVKVKVGSMDDVAWLTMLHIDIYTVREANGGFIVYGGAFDYQIDRIREKGIEVELIDTVGQGGQK